LKLTRTRRFTVNMGNYESFVTEAIVEVDGFTIEEADKKADYLLDEALKSDLQYAAKLSNVKDTYILTWNEEKYGRDH
jgi:hypothetical protein